MVLETVNQEQLVEKVKTLNAEQLVKATRLLVESIKGVTSCVWDATAVGIGAELDKDVPTASANLHAASEDVPADAL